MSSSDYADDGDNDHDDDDDDDKEEKEEEEISVVVRRKLRGKADVLCRFIVRSLLSALR